MADQTVRVAGLPDSGSPSRVAMDLFSFVRAIEGADKTKDRKSVLDLYAECLEATAGHRSR